MLKNNKFRGTGDCASIWSSKDKAQEFWESTQKNTKRYTPILSMISSHDPKNILDIGSGPGSLALPLASNGGQVTAIEPALGMSAVLAEKAIEIGITNLNIVTKRWEEVLSDDLSPPYDTVIACYSLGMPDIADAIVKMEEVCNGRIFLIWFAGVTPWEQVICDLWSHYHEEVYQTGPKADVLFQVLYEMGIFPDITVLRESSIEETSDLSKIVADYACRLCLQENSDLTYIEEYFRGLNIDNIGSVRLKGELTSMILSWESRRYFPDKYKLSQDLSNGQQNTLKTST
nr:class I SAM-dependent methyltransferase [uncultured Methanospirillum sp.]